MRLCQGLLARRPDRNRTLALEQAGRPQAFGHGRHMALRHALTARLQPPAPAVPIGLPPADFEAGAARLSAVGPDEVGAVAAPAAAWRARAVRRLGFAVGHVSMPVMLDDRLAVAAGRHLGAGLSASVPESKSWSVRGDKSAVRPSHHPLRHYRP